MWPNRSLTRNHKCPAIEPKGTGIQNIKTNLVEEPRYVYTIKIVSTISVEKNRQMKKESTQPMFIYNIVECEDLCDDDGLQIVIAVEVVLTGEIVFLILINAEKETEENKERKSKK
ncbi:hypothetical protein PV325_008717, partial [Microctonus aethiopoides]